MGCWGYQIFDCDESDDFLGTMVFDLIKTVHRALEACRNGSPGVNPFRTILPGVAIMRVLCQNIPSARTAVPKSIAVDWKNVYDAWFEREFRNVQEPVADQMKQIHMAEFEGLIELADGGEALVERLTGVDRQSDQLQGD